MNAGSFIVATKEYDNTCVVGMSIVTSFRKIEWTCCQPFQVCIKMRCVNRKETPMKKFTGMASYSIYKVREIKRKLTRLTRGEMKMSRK